MKATLLGLLCVLAWTSAIGAATGAITPDPPHLVIESGSLGTVNISWSTSGCATAEVYVSVDGGAESLVSRSANGSVNPNWIQPEKLYVFNLYEGTAHTNCLAWTSVTSQTPPASHYGFVYWPQYNTCSVLTDDNWTTQVKEEIQSDLDFMASYSGRLFRLMFWPHLSGYKIYPNGTGGEFLDEYDEVLDNLPELLSFYHERGLKVYVAFSNSYLRLKDPVTDKHWWELAYGSNNFNDFVLDSKTWINGIIDAVEGSNYAEDCLYYNLETESSDDRLNNWSYLAYMYDNCNVPKGKYCINLLRWHSEADEAVAVLGDRRFDYADFHCYPDVTGQQDHDPNLALQSIETYYPDATVVIGESAGAGPDPCGVVSTVVEPSTEATQMATELDLSDWALDHEIPYVCHWMLWDRTPDADNQVYGWAYSPHEPKDVMGAMTDTWSAVANGDMEVLASGQNRPANWNGGATVAYTFTAPGAGGYSATNNRYARLQINNTTGTGWIYSSAIPVTGGDLFFANCYVRSNMQNVKMAIKEYNSSMTVINNANGPTFTPSGWSWNHYLTTVGSWYVQLQANTAYVAIVIQGNAVTNPTYLDVDTVSGW